MNAQVKVGIMEGKKLRSFLTTAAVKGSDPVWKERLALYVSSTHSTTRTTPHTNLLQKECDGLGQVIALCGGTERQGLYGTPQDPCG